MDASVFLNAFNPYEPGHAASYQLLNRLQQQGIPIIVPILLLPEVAAAISRGRNDADLARRFADTLRHLPHLILMPVEGTLARQAVQIAADYCLRGSDAVYAAVALRFGSTLVTLDQVQHDRVAAAVATCWPAEALAELQP